jgi:hypothetical protein
MENVELVTHGRDLVQYYIGVIEGTLQLSMGHGDLHGSGPRRYTIGQ